VEVNASALHAVLFVEGVRKVELVAWVDIVPTDAQAAYCTGYSVTVAEPA
jgi:phage-related baseplate assembly protein